MRNFLSIGSQPQVVNFDNVGLTLVIGENNDIGEDGSRNGVGKAQPLTARIKTPNGWMHMGDLNINDIIVTPKGHTTKVTGVFPQGQLNVFSIKLADGRTTECCKEHLWDVLINNTSTFTTLSTDDIMGLVYNNNIYLPLAIPYTNKDTNLLIHPYILGVLLTNKSYDYVDEFTTKDEELVNSILSESKNYKLSLQESSHKSGSTYKVIGIDHDFVQSLDDLGFINTDLKFIPHMYKDSSIYQRELLLKGIIDNAGYILADGHVQLKTHHKQFAYDIQEMVWSLGGVCKVFDIKDDNDDDGTHYKIMLSYHTPDKIIGIKHKRERITKFKLIDKIRIDDIVYVGKKECQCIMVEDDNHLYVTDNYIVTHNTTMIQALCFGLFGVPLSNIKKDNLINKINHKNMSVIIEFEKDNKNYRIERTRKPNTIKWFVNDNKIDSPDNDEAQGESRWTQIEIEKTIGMSYELFRHIVVLSNDVIPFLNLPAKGQRDLIEELLGITALSNKAEQLKDLVKQTKDMIKEEEVKIRIINENNENNRKIINDLQLKSNTWAKQHTDKIIKINKSLGDLEHIDIDQEIDNHKKASDINDLLKMKKQYTNEYNRLKNQLVKDEESKQKLEKNMQSIKEHNCPTCGQDVHDDKIDSLKNELLEKQNKLNTTIQETLVKFLDIEKILNDFNDIDEKNIPTTHYASIDDAYNHRTIVDTLKNDLIREQEMVNPFDDQIKLLVENGIQDINYDIINDLTKYKEHQEFLIKLLTSKDSFIRKKIIDQNILFLNHRLSYYLDKLGLPHEVKFLNDLNTEILLLGKDYDFGNLSSGEKKRVIIALSFAFRDVWENMNHGINLGMFDEIFDSGIDQAGMETTWHLLKTFTQNNKKDIFVITHREELMSRSTNILKVIKDRGFTTFSKEL